MNLWLIKGNGSSGKLGDKEGVQVTCDGIFDCALFPYHRAAKKPQVLGQQQDKETLSGKMGVLQYLGPFWMQWPWDIRLLGGP